MSPTDDTCPEGKPNIHIDESWKDRARREKEQLARQAAGQEPMAAGADQAPEEASEFLMFISGLAAQAMLFMGLLPHTGGEKFEPNPDEAKAMIDLLDMLQKKTQGNLDEQEDATLKRVLYDLRMAYVQTSGKGQSGAGR